MTLDAIFKLISGFLPALFALLLALFGAGCISPNELAPAMFPQEFRDAVKAGAISVFDQTDWDDVAMNLDAHANNPGVRFWMSVTVEGGAGLDGLDGDFHVGAVGEGITPLSDDARGAILKLYEERGTGAQREYYLDLLGRLDATPAPEPTDLGGGE